MTLEGREHEFDFRQAGIAGFETRSSSALNAVRDSWRNPPPASCLRGKQEGLLESTRLYADLTACMAEVGVAGQYRSQRYCDATLERLLSRIQSGGLGTASLTVSLMLAYVLAAAARTMPFYRELLLRKYTLKGGNRSLP